MSDWKLEYAAEFVAKWEGFRSFPYQDTGGVWTIGYGHTAGVGPRSGPISRAEGKRLLTKDLRYAAQAVDRLVHVPLTTRERIACISFTYNVGVGGLESSSFLKYLNRGNRRKAANRLLLWVRDANGNWLLGLWRRRLAERRLFRYPKKGYKRW